jgi:hypothetical protein
VFEPSHEQSREFVQGGGLRLCEPIFEIAPEPFEGIELGGIGGEEEKAPVGRAAQGFGFVERTVIEQEEVAAGGIGSGEMVEKELKAVRIERR